MTTAISILSYIIIAGVLGANELNFLTWQYWVIMASLLALQLSSFDRGLNH